MLIRSVTASTGAAALSPFGLRRRRGVAADSSSSSAALLFPVAVGLLVVLLLVQNVAAVADRKTRRKSTSSVTSSPTADDVISADELFVDGLNYTTPTMSRPQQRQRQRHLANSTTFNQTAAAAVRTRGSHGDGQFEFVNPKPADLKIECQPLKSKRYITDGFCTSIRPVVDFVCTGTCLPIRQLPWYAEFIKVWSHTKTLQYRCVDDVIRHRKVTFACDNGETRSYRIRVVRSCKCKRYVRSQNDSGGSGKGRKTKKKPRNSAPPPDDDFDDEDEDDNFDDEDANW